MIDLQHLHKFYCRWPAWLRRPGKRVAAGFLFIIAWVYPMVANKK